MRAIETEDPDVIEEHVHEEAFLWYREHLTRAVQHGRSMVATTLARLHARRRPTHTAVYRVMDGTAVISAFADETALWTIEVVFRDDLADALSLSMPDRPVYVSNAP